MALQPQRWLLKQKQRAQAAACCAIVAAATAGGLSPGTPPGAYQLPSNSEVISYLLQSVNWYRHVYTERQVAYEPADLMFLNDNQAIERQIVKLSFEFAKADAMLEASTASSHGRAASSDPPPADLAHFLELKNRNDRLSQQAIEEIKNLDQKMNTAKGTDRGKLKAAEEDAQTRLQLLNAVAQGLNDLVEFVQTPGGGEAQSGHLGSIIDNLAQSVPFDPIGRRFVDHRSPTRNQPAFTAFHTAACSRSKSATVHWYEPPVPDSVRHYGCHGVRARFGLEVGRNLLWAS